MVGMRVRAFLVAAALKKRVESIVCCCRTFRLYKTESGGSRTAVSSVRCRLSLPAEVVEHVRRPQKEKGRYTFLLFVCVFKPSHWVCEPAYLAPVPSHKPG